MPDLPWTSNDREHCFGVARSHPRRATGCKHSTPGTVVRGAVCLLAAVTARVRTFRPVDLHPRDLAHWRPLSRKLTCRHQARHSQRRFRRNPTAYLQALEEHLLKLTLPP